MNLFTVRPAGPALDLSATRIRELTAENERLKTELFETRRVVDDLLDRESMHTGAACMERLTTAASITRLGQARARHIPVDSTATAASQLGTTGVFA
ncbi:hypothetical protein ACWDOP_00280 [Nocardia sp. NPDC003693]